MHRPNVAVAMIGFVILTVLGAALLRKPAAGTDWGVYLRATQQIRLGDNLYAPDPIATYSYPPAMILTTLPLVGLPEILQRPIWFAMNAGCLVGIVILLERWRHRWLWQADDAASRWRFWLPIGLLAGKPLLSPLQGLTHDLIVCLTVVLAVDAWSQQHRWRAGFWAGLGTALKATPALFLLMFIYRRSWKAAAACVISALLISAVPDFFWPSATGQSWGVCWLKTFAAVNQPGASAHGAGAWRAWNHLNQSLAGTLHRLTSPIDPPNEWHWDVSIVALSSNQRQALIVLAQLAVVCLLILSWRRATHDQHGDPRDRSLGRLGEAATILCGMVLLSPMSSKPHFCVMIVPTAFVVLTWRRHGLTPMPAILVILGAIGSWLTAKDLFGKATTDAMQAFGAMTWASVLLLLASTSCLSHRLVSRAAALASAEDSGFDRRAA